MMWQNRRRDHGRKAPPHAFAAICVNIYAVAIHLRDFVNKSGQRYKKGLNGQILGRFF
jgi:hypothetical protein